MLLNKVVLLGEADSGKTQILNCLIEAPFASNYKKTQLPIFCTAKRDKTIAEIWDTCGNEQDDAMVYQDIKIGLYCVDLSKEIEVNKIKTGIQAYREKCPETTLILVGTKCDQCTGDAQAIFSAIDVDADNRVMTSAKNSIGIKDLSNYLLTTPFTEQKNAPRGNISISDNQLTSWDVAISNVEYALANVSPDKKNNMQKELSILKDHIRDHSLDRTQAIERFVEKSQIILENKHSSVMKKVLKLAAVAVVTTLAALVGFGIGFAAGIWTGPGAFITGFLAGSAAAVSVVAVSVAGGGLTAYGLFKEPKELAAVKHFADELIRQPYF